MAVTFVGVTSGSANNGGNVTLTLPSHSANDVAIVAVTAATSRTGTLGVTSSSGAVYTQIVATITSSSARFGVFRRILASTGENTITVAGATGGSSDSTATVAHVFDGVDLTTPEDATPTSTTGSGTTPDSPSITVTESQCAIVTSIGLQFVSVPTAPSSFLNSTSINANDNWDACAGQAWITNTSTAAFNPASWTSSVSVSWCSATIALRPAEAPFETWPPLEIPSDFRFEMVGY